MTLDEAIGYANKKACGNGRCAEEHAQLADWLCELRISRIKIKLLKTIRDGFKTDAEYYKAENAKLRELLTDILSYAYDGGFICSEGARSCPYFQECFNCPIEEGPERYVRRGCRWLARGRELGIEVK